MRCVIDFDGTIRSWTSNEPEKGVKESLTRLKNGGYKISILSCRTSIEFINKEADRIEQTEMIKNYLIKHEIPFDEVLDYDKPIADVYIDDAGIEYSGSNWREIADRLVGEKNEED